MKHDTYFYMPALSITVFILIKMIDVENWFDKCYDIITFYSRNGFNKIYTKIERNK